jgi:hypothetical protein
VPTTYSHFAEGCGVRIASPHDACQRITSPFLAGERLARRFGEVIVVCVVCRAAWREVTAPAEQAAA